MLLFKVESNYPSMNADEELTFCASIFDRHHIIIIVIIYHYFLVFASDVDASDFGRSEMHLIPEPLFAIPSDNCHITCIQGTHDGRIFLATKDASLYELIYQVGV